MRALIFIHVLYLILIKTFTVKGAAKCDSKVELRAVLLSCPVKDSGCDDDDPLSQAMRAEDTQVLETSSCNSERIKEEKSREFPSAVKDCKRKLVITLKIKNAGKIPCDDEYIIVDHVYDPLTGGRGRLLSPVVVKLRQEQMVQLYGLQFQRVVNSDPFEEQKTTDNTCSIDPQNPSCGIAVYDGKPIPFSEGFCCSCDPHVNAKRQLSPLSHGESFPYRNSKLVYQGNMQFPNEEKTSMIYNPELVKFKAGIPSDVQPKESETPDIIDTFLGDKIPNFLLEGDRKIVCDKGDFMKELCLSRDGIKEVPAKADFRKKSALEDFGINGNGMEDAHEGLPFLADPEGTTVALAMGGPQSLSDNLEKNTVELQNFIKSLNLERPLTPDPLPKKGVRGKRENRREMKKLSLEEKLSRFANSRERLTGRRKRLMEISHKRFRKTDDRRPYADESGFAMESWRAPPRYFFSHDRAIVDPLESLYPAANSSCESMKENICEYPNKNRELETAKIQNCRRFEENKENLVDRKFYQLTKSDNKVMRKDKYFGGKVGVKKDKGNTEGEKEEKQLKKDENGEEEKDEDEFMMKEGKDQNSHFHAKNIKNFLHKNDREKTKLKHLFSARNREKDNPELIKQKMDELATRVGMENPIKEQQIKKLNNGAETVVQDKGKELKDTKGNNDDVVWETLQFSTENIKLLQQPQSESYEGRAKLVKDPGRRYQVTSGNNYEFPRPEEAIGNVDFNIKIIRNQGPETYQRKQHYQAWANRLPGKTRAEVSPKWYGSNIYATTEKFRQNPFVPHPPSDKLYPYGKQNRYQETYMMKRVNALHPKHMREFRKDLWESSKNVRRLPHDNAYGSKKPAQGHYFMDDDYTEGNSFSAKWSDGDNPRSSHAQGKHHPELFEQKVEKAETDQCENIRSKRSASYSFQPAKGFFESDVDSQVQDGSVIHELEGCGRRRSCQFSRLKQGNGTTDASTTSLNGPASGGVKRSVKLPDKQRLIQSYLNAPDYVLEEIESVSKGKREIDRRKQKHVQEGTPFECADPQDTAHCMRFGDLWYSLYTIRKPMISQLVGVQLFDKHTVGEGTEWRDLTKGKMIRIGTFLAKAEDELPSISVTFSGEKTGRARNAIDPDNYFLLIPSHVSDASKTGFYPQLEGGPSEYMLVPTKEISSGGECNMIGTSFEAFARQPDRCSQRRGSCLKRQPVDLWREDMEARIRGKRGKYFVENFGNIPNSPIKSYTNLTGEFLALEYYGEYTSTIEIEVKADSNAIIRRGSIAQIPLVYIDSTYPKKTRIILSLLNSGFTSSNFRPRLGDCPPDLDVAWCPLEGPLVTIPPQQRHDFKLDLSGALPTKEILLSVQVLNQINKEVALRKIIIKKDHRCMCAFHCKCNCFGSSKDGRSCRKLGQEEYRKAGYTGVYPFRGGAAAYTEASGSVLKYVHTILGTASCFLLLFGILKAFMGLFVRRIGIAGVRVITGPRQISSYYESELKGCSVLCDDCGFPVHPTTCRPVQIVPLCLEVILNVVFFFIYPLRGIWFLIMSLPCCSLFYSDCDSCCRREESENDQKCSRPLLSKEPEPTFVHYNLTTINPKKSKHEYLPYPAYKGDDDPLEEDDTEFVLQEMKRYRKK